MYTQIKNWKDNYFRPGMTDQRAVEDFLVCETYENVMTFRNELTAVRNGRGRKDILENMLGKKRLSQHGTFTKWAKMMLLWIASARK